MSRFWAAASSSEGEKDSDSDSFDDNQQNQQVAGGRFNQNIVESDSDSGDEVRVVKSQKDRKWDAIREAIARLENAQRNNDWPQIVDEFDIVNKQIDRSKMLILQHGLPKFYIKLLVDIEDFVKTALKDTDLKKKLKPVVLRALQQMKLKVKKHNEKYKPEIEDCRENPSKYVEIDDDDEEEEEEEEEDVVVESENEDDLLDKKPITAKASAVKPKSKFYAGDEEDEEDSLFGDDIIESDEESEAGEGRAQPLGRAKWVKATEISKAPKVKFEEGARIEANFKGRGKWLLGKIKRDREDGTFDVEYDESGDTENKVKEEHIRKPVASSHKAPVKPKFDEGSKVEFNHKGIWLIGRIRKARRDGTYDIDYDGDEVLRKISAESIRKIVKGRVDQSVSVEEKMTEEVLDKKISELIASRGKKGTILKEVLRQLEALSKAARYFGTKKEIPVLMHLISSMFDSQRNIDDYMDLMQWRTCHRSLTRIVKLLETNKKIVLNTFQGEEASDVSLAANQLKGGEDSEIKTGVVGDEKTSNLTVLKVVGSIETFVLRLQDEYIKSLQQINPHTQEYVVRLSDEASLIELAESIITYYKRVAELIPIKKAEELTAAANVSLMIVEHLYYKHDIVATAVQRAHLFNKAWGGKYSDFHPACIGKLAATMSNSRNNVKKNFGKEDTLHPASYLGNPTVSDTIDVDYAKKVEEFASFIYKHGEEKIKTRVLLCSVYHHALHDRYYQARDIFLISHVQDFIDKADIRTQILYNRALAMVGLSAFRLGLFQKAYDCLSGICGNKLKELLAQGIVKWVEKDAEQERVERRRQIPYHMHINPDLLESCHLICAMLLELPHLAKATPNVVVSKIFRRYLLSYTKQVFTGPPENTREHVLAATKALLAGDWKKACDCITKLDVWNLLPNDGGEKVKAMLETKLKEEAVRTFLLINCEFYDSLSLNHVCRMFSVDHVTARKIICRMIFNKEISAAWDIPSDILILYKNDNNQIQALSKNVIEKLTLLLESNERILDPLVGTYGYKDNDWVNTTSNAQRGGARFDAQQLQQQQDTSRNRRQRNLGWRTNQQYLINPSKINAKHTGSSSRSQATKAAWGSSGNRSGFIKHNNNQTVNFSEQPSQSTPQVSSQNIAATTHAPKKWATVQINSVETNN